MYIWDAQHGAQADVTGECLRQLTALPQTLIEPLLTHFGEGAAPAVQLGLFHLLIYHQAGVQGREYLRRALPGVRNIDLYRYLVMSMIAAGDDGLLEDLTAHASQVRDARRAGVLREAAELAGGRARSIVENIGLQPRGSAE
ncbi:MAG: hypothetical protein IPK16_20385 [Anaerolineales bacterium]|nr:hypothetical protein [Anaerolineales bacterium]